MGLETSNRGEELAPGSERDIQDEPQRLTRVHGKTFLVVFAICLIYFAQLFSLVGAGAQGQIIAAHFGETRNAIWLTAPLAMMPVVLGPIISQAADYWGRKWFLVVMTSFSVIGAIIFSRADSMNMAIAGSTVIGICFATQPLLHTVTSEILPRQWRAYGQAAIFTSNSLGSICGLLVGGALNRTGSPASEGFRTYYYIAMAISVVATTLIFVVYDPPALKKQRQLTTRQKLQKLDWTGYFFLAAGLTLFMVGLSWFDNPFEFSDPHVAATFAVGLALAAALIIYETFLKKDGMFHHALFKRNRNFSVTLFCVFVEGVAFFAANTYFAFEVSELYETDAILVGARYCIMWIVVVIAAFINGWFCSKYKRTRSITFSAFLIFVAFFACMAETTPSTNNEVWGYAVLLGTGLGMTLTTLVTVAQLSTPPELIAIASGLLLSVRSLGGTVGLAIYNALFNAALDQLEANVAQAVVSAGLPSENAPGFITALTSKNETALLSVPNVTSDIIQAGTNASLSTYSGAFRHVWIAAACFVALAALASLLLIDQPKEFNMHIDAPVEEKEDTGSI
ncbi:major facilitator superfamily domain-containing protein [Xylariaceae sp. FL0016]|nr:major facilitator superfamily domain-containing protein [Xylariaceae sp. FL0016]